MANRAELMESVLDGYPEGVALMDADGQVVFWNHAAESITGFAGLEVVARPLPGALQTLCSEPDLGEPSASHGALRAHAVSAQHRLGHGFRASARTLVLRDGLGERIGMAILFHPSECLDTLPHGDTGEAPALDSEMELLEERMEAAFDDFKQRGTPLGLLWVTVDQAHELRRTHGARACQAMLERVERTLINGLRPQDDLGRWGEDDFLILAHERRPQGLAAFAQHIAGLTRTAEFRWWGDRISLTASVGAALSEPDETLPQLLERAKAAMLAGVHIGGNHMTLAPRRFPGNPSTDEPTVIRREIPQDTSSNAQEQEPGAPDDSEGRQACSPS
ncbi:MAG TPA: diguanylate cyclase [Terracidiphilus sp.]|nr:diguanylate cyclase [Terracidiphilus sp.]